MEITNLTKLQSKDLIVFDLDGTIIKTKSPMDLEMSGLIARLLASKRVAVIGGGKYEVFKSLFIQKLKVPPKLLKNLFLFPTTATAFYRYNSGWKIVYAHMLSAADVKKIKDTFEKVFQEIGYKHPKKVYGELIENRGSQVSFSVYGQDLVTVLGSKGIKMKEEWKRKHTPTKMKIAKLMAKYLPQFESKAAGFTTIDVTKKGIDKAYGVRQIQKHLKMPISKMLFVGDAIFPGGNDYAALKTGIDYVKVSAPEETKKIIKKLI